MTRVWIVLLLFAVPASALETALIEQASGAKGTLQDGVFVVRLPRADLTVDTAGVRMVPALGLTAWAAFQAVGAQAMMMGDLVLLEDQVNPVMDAAFAAGLEVTALHNHFLWDTPKVMFMHVGGMGDVETLASAVGRVFGAITATAGGRGVVPRSTVDPTRTALDTAALTQALGVPGTLAGGAWRISIGRSVSMHGQAVGGAMGVNSWAAFAGSDARAIVDGDVAVRESELQQTLRALRGNGLFVTAIHNHMTGEEPRMLFVHYWGAGPARHLAAGLRAVLAAQEK